MDYIINLLNDDLEISEENSVDQSTLLKERVEYYLIMTMGYLYHKNMSRVSTEVMKEVNDNLLNLTFGKVISNIRSLDIEHELWESKKKKYELLDGYTKIRNEYIGHGYIHEDAVAELKTAYINYYSDMCDRLEWFQKKKEYILVTGKDDDNYHGIRFDARRKNTWICNRKRLEKFGNIVEKDVFLMMDGVYYKISPFVSIENKGMDIYLFSSLSDKRTGEVKLCRLLVSDKPKKLQAPLFICDYVEEEIYKKSSSGTIMNKFELNYKKYMETPVEQDIFDYLANNTSNVQATLWGHGGVGKTAAVQYVCDSIFHGHVSEKNRFKYVIFTTAKDRKFDPRSGEIVKLENLRTYADIIQQIMMLIFEEKVEDNPKSIIECEEKIAQIEDKFLLVVDDYETYSDTDKQSIQEFINRLNINYHRVIITTRNKKLANGIPIQTNEFNEDDTINFFNNIVSCEFPRYINKANEIISLKDNCVAIHKATEGRAISIHHFVNLLVQRGFSDELLKEMHASENMSRFLYDRIYDLLSDDAKNVFCCIALLVNKESLIFSIKTVEFIVDEIIGEQTLDDLLDELVDQKVVEKTGTEFLYRVYASNIYAEMRLRYDKLDNEIKQLIDEKKKQLGGSFEIRSIGSALLTTARKAKVTGTYEEIREKYLFAFKNKNVDNENKKEAIMEYLEFVATNGKDSKDILENRKNILLRGNKEIEVMYVKALWNIDQKGKDEAISVLIKKDYSKIEENNVNDICLKLWYSITYYLELYKQKNDISYKNKLTGLLIEGNMLFEYIRGIDLIVLGIKQDILKEALLSIIAANCILNRKDESKLKRMKYYIDFYKKNLKLMYPDRIFELEKEVQSILSKVGPGILNKYSFDDMIEATVIKVRDNFVQCKVNPNFVGCIFSTSQILDLRKDDVIFVKIKNINKYNEIEFSYEGFKE